MIVFDVSTLVGAAFKRDGVPERAPLRAEAIDLFALSADIEAEMIDVLNRRKFVRAISRERRESMIAIIRDAAVGLDPTVRITECRDAKEPS